MGRDGDDFRALVQANAPRLYRTALRLLANGADAEDVVQETFTRAYGAFSSGAFRGEAQAGTYLYRIVVNASLNRLKSRQRWWRWLRTPLDEAAPEVPVAPMDAEARVALREMAERLDRLPAEQRAAIVLTQVEGLSNAEAAAALGCSEGAVEQRLIRARAALRRGDQDERA